MKINLSKLKHNAIMIKRLCEHANVSCFPVTKGVSAATEVIEILKEAGFTKFADSRLQHLHKIRKMMGNSVELLLIRTPALSEVEETVLTADISLNSELCVIEALGRAATKYGKIHRVILMIDLGDLREGMLPQQMVEVSQRVVGIQGIELVGIGANFTCFSGVIPTESSLLELTQLTELVEEKIGQPLSIISGEFQFLTAYLTKERNRACQFSSNWRSYFPRERNSIWEEHSLYVPRYIFGGSGDY